MTISMYNFNICRVCKTAKTNHKTQICQPCRGDKSHKSGIAMLTSTFYDPDNYTKNKDVKTINKREI